MTETVFLPLLPISYLQFLTSYSLKMKNPSARLGFFYFNPGDDPSGDGLRPVN